MMKQYLLLVILLACVGCVGKSGQVYMGLGSAFHYWPPHSAPQMGTLQQAFVIEKDDQRVFQFDGYLELSPTATVLLGMTPMGTRAFSIAWDGQTAAREALPFYSMPVDDRELLACLQILMWDEETAKAFLRDQGFTVEYRRGETRLLKGNRVYITIQRGRDTFPYGEMVLQHHVNQYILRVRTRQFIPFP